MFDISTSKEDRVAYNILVNSAEHLARHFQSPLLWRPDTQLPNNSYVMAQRRLVSLKKRLASDTVLCNTNKYIDVLETYITKDMLHE